MKHSFNLRTVADVLFRRKWLIITTFLTTALTAVLLAVYLPDQYESRMKFLVRNMRSDVQITPERTQSSNVGEVSEAQIISEIELLKSRDLLEQVVRKTDLAEPSQPNRAITPDDIERAVYKLEKDLDIAPVKKSNIIEVSYNSKSAEKSAAVLDQLSELYLDKHLRIHRPPGTYDFFKEQSDQFKKELHQAENNMTGFQKRMNVVSIDQQKSLTLTKFVEVQSRLDDLNGAIRETERRIAEIEQQIGKVDKRIMTQSRVVPNQYSEERLNTMLVELKNRRIQMLTKYQPSDRLIVELDDQIRTTTEALDKAKKLTYTEKSSEPNPLSQTLEAELSKAKVEQTGRLALRDNLTKQVLQYRGELNKLEGATVIHDNLSRQVKQAEGSYQLYAEKQEESRIADALDAQKISNVSIAEAPTVPRVPFKSNRPLTAALGIAAGLLLGFGCAVVAELFRETVHTPGELEALTNLPVLATVPFEADTGRLFNFEPISEASPDVERTEEIVKIEETGKAIFGSNLQDADFLKKVIKPDVTRIPEQ